MAAIISHQRTSRKSAARFFSMAMSWRRIVHRVFGGHRLEQPNCAFAHARNELASLNTHAARTQVKSLTLDLVLAGSRRRLTDSHLSAVLAAKRQFDREPHVLSFVLAYSESAGGLGHGAIPQFADLMVQQPSDCLMTNRERLPHRSVGIGWIPDPVKME
jgi:hypothetical protein